MAWWYAVSGADWRHPEGPDSTIAQRMDHPVVQVSRNDAIAYCQWAKSASRQKQSGRSLQKAGQVLKISLGREFLAENTYHCNIWQGEFPKSNTRADGFCQYSASEMV